MTSSARATPKTKRPEAIKEAVASLAGTARDSAGGCSGFDAGIFDSWPAAKNAAPRAVRWISHRDVITLITGIEIARESHPKPRERPIIFITTFD